MTELFSTLAPIVGGPAVAIIAVVYIYLKINTERKNTKTKRDKDSEDIHDKILKHDFEIAKLKDDMVLHNTVQQDLQHQLNVLSEATAKLSISVEHFSESVRDLKDEIKELRNKNG